ncbi:MAG: helix-turn-helix transcriptional regulator [Coriobacteriales bacterium]|jgi:DNA-binding CsgD family transcriptional regulator|nr:helix-turn-helix transcriptional regulator [Coriobacteriales bacterium]
MPKQMPYGAEAKLRERGLNKELSIRRIVGFSLDRLWVLMLFYSVVPHFSSSDVRGSLYMTFFVSLCAMVVTMLFILIVAQRNDELSSNRLFIFGAACLTTLGTIAALFADMSTPGGMLFLGIGAILTGVGSAMLFLGWLEVFASLRERLALLELAFSTAASFVMGFILIALSSLAAIGVIAALPFASGYLLCANRGNKTVVADANESTASSGEAAAMNGGAMVMANGCGSAAANGSLTTAMNGGTMVVASDGTTAASTSADTSPAGSKTIPRFSRQAIILFIKALGGTFLLGVLAGFFDVLSGYQTYAVQDIYGIYLFLGGFLAVLVICLITLFCGHADIFAAYRFSILLLCLGCLLTPFMSDNYTYSNAVIFGGYNCFILVLCVVCLNISNGFTIAPIRAVGIGFCVLYAGEIVGYALAYVYDTTTILPFSLISVTLVAVSLLFVAHLFLFTEVDLVRAGIGEVDLVAMPDESDGNEKTLVATDDSCAHIIERYALSPRESDVLPLLLQGRTISRIQEALFISAGTVSTHIRHIYQKTGVNNRQELLDLVQNSLNDATKASA